MTFLRAEQELLFVDSWDNPPALCTNLGCTKIQSTDSKDNHTPRIQPAIGTHHQSASHISQAPSSSDPAGLAPDQNRQHWWRAMPPKTGQTPVVPNALLLGAKAKSLWRRLHRNLRILSQKVRCQITMLQVVKYHDDSNYTLIQMYSYIVIIWILFCISFVRNLGL